MKGIHLVTFALVVAGALNWGLVGLLEMNVVDLLVGNWPTAERVIYILVGLAAVYELATHMHRCKHCGDKGMMNSA
jgi:uncharacterized membrane protein YuzA (DUF378 family)